eukprot:584574_1
MCVRVSAFNWSCSETPSKANQTIDTMEWVYDDVLFTIFANLDLEDIMIRIQHVCQRWCNLIDVTKCERRNKHKIIKLWSRNIKYSLSHNIIIQSLDSNSQWKTKFDQIYFSDDVDGTAMYHQFIHAVQYIHCTAQFERNRSLHPWFSDRATLPSSQRFSDHKMYNINALMEPDGFDPNREQIIDTNKEIMSLQYLLNINIDNLNFVSTQLYDSMAMYSFIWILSFIVNNHRSYGYQNCYQILKNKLDLVEWQCQWIHTRSHMRYVMSLHGGMAMFLRRTGWLSQSIDVIDIALTILAEMNGDVYQKPNRRNRLYSKNRRMFDNSPRYLFTNT